MEEVNFGGTGDCGWRCAAAMQAMVNGKTEAQVREKIVALAAGLRMRAALQLEKDKTEWIQGWLPEKVHRENVEDGPRIETADEFIEAMKKRKNSGSAVES